MSRGRIWASKDRQAILPQGSKVLRLNCYQRSLASVGAVVTSGIKKRRVSEVPLRVASIVGQALVIHDRNRLGPARRVLYRKFGFYHRLHIWAQVDTSHVGIAHAKGTEDLLVRCINPLDGCGRIVSGKRRQVVECRRAGILKRRGMVIERRRLPVGWSIRIQLRIRSVGKYRRGRSGELSSALMGKHGASLV